MISVYLDGRSGTGTQWRRTAMYEPAFRAHPAFRVVDDPAEAEVASVVVPLAERAKTILGHVAGRRHVLADQPLAATVEETVEIARHAAERGVVVVPALHQRLGGALRSVRAALRAGRIGLPWNVQCDFLVAGGDPAPGGELADLGPYPIDVIHALLGLDVVRVHVVGGPSLVTLQLDHEYGVTSTIVCGRVPPLADVPPAGLAVHRYRISGTHGVLAVDATKPALRVRGAAGPSHRWTGPGTLDRLLDVLVTGVRTGRAEIGAREDVYTQRVVAAALRSMDTGGPVSLRSDS